jgi:hypothetical protein
VAIHQSRDFSLNELPRDETGAVLYRGDSEAEYLAYVRWLADYLYHAPLTVPESQRAWCDDLSRSVPVRALNSLGYTAFWYGEEVAEAHDYWRTPRERRRVARRRRRDPEAARIRDEEVARMLAEEAEMLALFGDLHEDYADLGWRTPMAVVVKQVHDHDERVNAIRQFFAGYVEDSRK